MVRHWVPGETYRPTARDLNATAEAVEYFQLQKNSGAGLGLPRHINGRILVKNGTEDDWTARYPIIGLDDILIDVAANKEEFLRQCVWNGVKPEHPIAWPEDENGNLDLR